MKDDLEEEVALGDSHGSCKKKNRETWVQELL